MDETAQPDDTAAGCEAAARRLLLRVERACVLAEPWPVRVRIAIDSALGLIATEPELGHLLLVESYARGRAAQLRHEETLARLADLLAVGREEIECGPLPEMLEQGLIGAAAFVVGRPLRAGTAQQLSSLAPELTALLLTPYLGREEAERVAAGGDPSLD